jgi:hypothetical protein
MTQVLPFAHRGLEQRFLNVARHIPQTAIAASPSSKAKVCCSVMSLLPDFYV